MGEKIESSSGADINTKIQEKLKQLLKDDFELFEQQDINTILSLDDKNKELLLSALSNTPELVKKLEDNLPINNDKLLRILGSIKLNIQHINSSIQFSSETKQFSSETKQISSETKQTIVETKIDQMRIHQLSIEEQKKKEFFAESDKIKKEIKLQENPKYKEYQAQAQKELVASNPGIDKNKDFQNYVDAYIMIEHQKEFLAGRPDLQASFDALTKNAGTLEVFRSIKIDDYVNINYQNSAVLKSDVEKLQLGFVSNGEELHIEGNTFTLGDQVQVLEKSGEIKSYIRSDGFLIPISEEIGDTSKLKYEKSGVKDKTKKVESDITKNIENGKKVNENILRLKAEIKHLKETNGDKNTIEILEIELEKDEKFLKDLEINDKKYKEQLLGLDTKGKELDDKINGINSDYRSRVYEAQEKARQELRFFHNIGITLFQNQSDFDYMMEMASINSNYHGLSKPFSYENLLNPEVGKVFQTEIDLINFWNRIRDKKPGDKFYIDPKNVGNLMIGQKDVGYDLLKLDKSQVIMDSRKTFQQSQRGKYDKLIDLIMINLSYIDRIWKKWPSKIKNAY